MISKKVQVCTQKDQANTVTPCTGAESDAQPMLSIRLVGASNKVFFPFHPFIINGLFGCVHGTSRYDPFLFMIQIYF
jgi:hypothetical protein